MNVDKWRLPEDFDNLPTGKSVRVTGGYDPYNLFEADQETVQFTSKLGFGPARNSQSPGRQPIGNCRISTTSNTDGSAIISFF